MATRESGKYVRGNLPPTGTVVPYQLRAVRPSSAYTDGDNPPEKRGYSASTPTYRQAFFKIPTIVGQGDTESSLYVEAVASFTPHELRTLIQQLTDLADWMDEPFPEIEAAE